MGIFNWRDEKFEQYLESLIDVDEYKWIHGIEIFKSFDYNHPEIETLTKSVNLFLKRLAESDYKIIDIINTTRKNGGHAKGELIVTIHYKYKQLIKDK